MSTTEDNKIKKRRICPACGAMLRLGFDVSIDVDNNNHEDALKDWRETLSGPQVLVVENAEATGLLKAFQETVEAAKNNEMPRSIEAFFLTFLRTAAPKRVPQFALDAFKAAYPDKQIGVWGAQGILCVMADGCIRLFVPTNLVQGKSIRGINPNTGITGRLPAPEDEFHAWIKTRMGYVAGKGAMFEMLRAKSIGQLARPVL